MHLDHFVVHINDATDATQAATSAVAAGLPFDPKKGKGSKGFRATNIWIGREYFEIAWLKTRDGGGWVPEWVERYNRGARGLVCLFLRTNRLDDFAHELTERKVTHRIERTSFKVFFGLYTVRLPWRILLLPVIPGTDFEISFIEYDRGVIERYSKHWKPNARDHGISGVNSARIMVPDLSAAVEFLRQIFPDGVFSEGKFTIVVDEGTIEVLQSSARPTVELIAARDPGFSERTEKFAIENVRVVSAAPI